MSESVADSPPVVLDDRLSEVLDVGRGRAVDWIEKAWRFFCSLKLMVVLMSAFTAAMAFGTFLNPKDDALVNIEHAFAARPWIIDLYKAFELYAPFRSWWFELILMLLALNNLASSIERLPRIFLIVKNPQKRLDDKVLRGLRLKRTDAAAVDPAKVEREFAAAGYRVSRADENGVTYLFGERGRWTRFGVWLVHVALLVICTGALGNGLVSFEGTMNIAGDGSMESFFTIREPDGTILPKPLVDEHGHRFALRCDKFYLDTFKDGSARRYASDLAVIGEDGRVIQSKKIIVNDPLHYAGMKFYQATYSQDDSQARAVMTITDRKTGETKEVEVTPEHDFSLGDGSVRYTVVNYEQKYGELGPAVQVVREEGPRAAAGTDAAKSVKSTDFWVFENYPDFDKDFRGDRYALKFDKLEPLYLTGIQVGYSPGIPYVLFGCALVWLGLFVAFWTAHRRVWARIEDGKLTLAGAAHRKKEQFAKEFDALAEKLGLPPKPSAG